MANQPKLNKHFFLRRQRFSQPSERFQKCAKNLKTESKSHRGWLTIVGRQRPSTSVSSLNRIAMREFCRNQSLQQDTQKPLSVAPSSNVRSAVSPCSTIHWRFPGFSSRGGRRRSAFYNCRTDLFEQRDFYRLKKFPRKNTLVPHRASGKRRSNKKSISRANTLFPSQLNSLMAPGSIGRAKWVIVEEVHTLALHDPMACLAAYPFPFPCCSKASKSSP